MPLPDFVNEPVRVEIRLSADGQALPASFTWRGRRITLLGVGRERHEESDGVIQTGWLARGQDGVTYELRFDPLQVGWTLVRVWRNPAVAS
jgi:hypothetical protein